ncbi:MAG: thioesterase family protein [Gemmatimonadota bacterium]|jgi:acyl-CoA thioester hydrolase
MSRRSRSTFRVRYAETDQMGLVHHAAYLVWCEIGRTDFIRELGMSYAEIEQSGVYLAVADANLRYGAGARYDDLIRVETWVEHLRSRTLTFGYEIHRVEPEPAHLARGTTTLICIDGHGRTRRLPDAVAALFEDT